jgi:hypothetical protein
MADDKWAIWEKVSSGWRLHIGIYAWSGKTKAAIRKQRDEQLYNCFREYSRAPEFIWLATPSLDTPEDKHPTLGAVIFQTRGGWSYQLVHADQRTGCACDYPGKSHREVEDICRRHLAGVAYNPAEDELLGAKAGTKWLADEAHPALGYYLLAAHDIEGRQAHAQNIRWQRSYREHRAAGMSDHQARECIRCMQ